MRVPISFLKQIIESKEQEGSITTKGGNTITWKKWSPIGASGEVVDFDLVESN